MRAPGHPQGCALMEAAMDDLADKLGHRPARVPAQEPRPERLPARPIYEAEVKIGAELIGWRRTASRAARTATGRSSTAYGMALHQWGGGGTPRQAGHLHDQPRRLGRAEDAPPRTSAPASGPSWRSSPPRCWASSRPTSRRTSATRRFPPGQPSGGSTTTPSMAPPCLDAVTQARDALFAKIAPAVEADAGRPVRSRTASSTSRASRSWPGRTPAASWAWRSISETGDVQPKGSRARASAAASSPRSRVDIETGVVRVKKIVAIQDSGLIIDKLTWESQVYGGVIMRPELRPVRGADHGPDAPA